MFWHKTPPHMSFKNLKAHVVHYFIKWFHLFYLYRNKRDHIIKLNLRWTSGTTEFSWLKANDLLENPVIALLCTLLNQSLSLLTLTHRSFLSLFHPLPGRQGSSNHSVSILICHWSTREESGNGRGACLCVWSGAPKVVMTQFNVKLMLLLSDDLTSPPFCISPHTHLRLPPPLFVLHFLPTHRGLLPDLLLPSNCKQPNLTHGGACLSTVLLTSS